tara:strand:- start:1001 stop:1108 length:108 start_codon:yes stop_codon:yes gene_type:complete
MAAGERGRVYGYAEYAVGWSGARGEVTDDFSGPTY